MVCSKCEKKLAKSMHIDTWKEGSRGTGEAGGRKLNENKALSAKKRWTPYGSSGSGTGGGKCRVCKVSLHQEGIYCQKCAYSKGMCSMCGVKVMDISFYNIGSDDWNHHAKDTKAKEEVDGGDGDGRSAGGGESGGDADGGKGELHLGSRAVAADDDDDAGGAGRGKSDDNVKKSAAAPSSAEDGKKRSAEETVLAAAEASAAREKQKQAEQISHNRLHGTTSLANAAREMATAATGQAVTGWQYDHASGYYYDVQSQMYFDPASQAYFVNGKWVQSAAPTASQMATGRQAGSFKNKTRVPDKFGL